MVLALVGAALGISGCVPGAAWLPDSSGFVYTGRKGSALFHFDVKKGEQRVLVADTGAPTLWPAVSPDGQRIAVAKLIVKPGQKQTQLQVAVYDRSGKELERSKALDYIVLDREPKEEEFKGEAEPLAQLFLPQLFWAPSGHHIVINNTFGAAIYDVQTKKLIWSSPGALLVFRGGPIRPDGAGFLVVKTDKGAEVKDLRFVFVDWAGREQPIKVPPRMLDEAAAQKEKDALKGVAVLAPLLFESGWEGDVAQVSYYADRLRYFTKKGEAVLDNVQPVWVEGGVVLCQYRFKGAQAQLRIVMEFDQDKGPELTKGFRVEVLKAGKKDAEVLVASRKVPILLPAPNGLLASIYCLDDNRQRPTILVVNDKGEVVANVMLE
jgi:hypothetical protein